MSNAPKIYMPPDIVAKATATMEGVTAAISDMIASKRQPPPEGMFLPAVAEAIRLERERCAALALKPLAGPTIAHLIRSGAEP